jgi:hypothetical protein
MSLLVDWRHLRLSAANPVLQTSRRPWNWRRRIWFAPGGSALRSGYDTALRDAFLRPTLQQMNCCLERRLEAMRYLVLLSSLAMPIVAWFAQAGAFGPDNGTLSARYPTLVVAAGYAFAIWGPIFLLDALFGIWQVLPGSIGDAALQRIRPVAAAGFALTSAWMIVFPAQIFWLALLIIWADLACLLYCALVLAGSPQRMDRTTAGRLRSWVALLPLSLHAGWLALAVFLNLAQVIVAYQLLPTGAMLGWGLPLLAAAAAVLLIGNRRMRGNAAFAFAGIWGLIGVYVKQSESGLPGAATAAAAAALLAAVLALQTGWLLARRR